MIRTSVAAAAAAVAVISLNPPVFGQVAGSHRETGAHVMIIPSELKWVDIPSLPPGAKIAVIEGPMSDAVPFTAQLKFPANYRIAAHWHPAVEHVTVLSGTFHIGTGDR